MDIGRRKRLKELLEEYEETTKGVFMIVKGADFCGE